MTQLRWQRVTENMAECENGCAYMAAGGMLYRCSANIDQVMVLHGETPLQALDRITGTTWPPEDGAVNDASKTRTPTPVVRG